jgi:hypothetical protein
VGRRGALSAGGSGKASEPENRREQEVLGDRRAEWKRTEKSRASEEAKALERVQKIAGRRSAPMRERMKQEEEMARRCTEEMRQ